MKKTIIFTAVTAFFEGYAKGLAETVKKEGKELTPRAMKEVVTKNFEKVSESFNDFMPQMFLILRFGSLSEAREVIRREFGTLGKTDVKRLLTLALDGKEGYGNMVTAYQENMYMLLDGLMPEAGIGDDGSDEGRVYNRILKQAYGRANQK